MGRTDHPNPFGPQLEAQGVVLLDGGLATELEARGHDLGDALWSARLLADDPAAIRAVHDSYLDAGADCLTTASYQATLVGFRRRGFGEREAERLILRAAELGLEARDAFWGDAGRREGRLRPLVAASVGPYAAYLADGSEYTGRYDIGFDGLVDFHRPRWRLLAGSGADLLGCETIPALDEARALRRLLDETPGAAAWFSFCCRDGERLSDGTPVEQAAAAVVGERALAVGVNCTAPRHVPALLRRLAGVAGIPALLAYPNSGESWDAARRAWSGAAGASDPAEAAAGWRAAGARLIGGCCRVGPGAIRRMRRRLLGPPEERRIGP